MKLYLIFLTDMDDNGDPLVDDREMEFVMARVEPDAAVEWAEHLAGKHYNRNVLLFEADLIGQALEGDLFERVRPENT